MFASFLRTIIFKSSILVPCHTECFTATTISLVFSCHWWSTYTREFTRSLTLSPAHKNHSQTFVVRPSTLRSFFFTLFKSQWKHSQVGGTSVIQARENTLLVSGDKGVPLKSLRSQGFDGGLMVNDRHNHHIKCTNTDQVDEYGFDTSPNSSCSCTIHVLLRNFKEFISLRVT